MKLRLHFVVDPMGWLCISVVIGIWLYNTFFIPKLVLLPHYNEGHIPWATVVCECSCSRCWDFLVDIMPVILTETCHALKIRRWDYVCVFMQVIT